MGDFSKKIAKVFKMKQEIFDENRSSATESAVQQQQCGGQDDGDRGLPAQPGDHVHHGGLDPQEGLEEGGPPLTR